MKYIDADRLKAEIERLQQQNDTSEDKDYPQYELDVACGYDMACEEILSSIISLQQERPEVDLVTELEHHLATTSKEQLEKEWKELEPWGNIGPTVQEFLYGKQPEVDLEKEIENKWKECHPTDEGMGLESANIVNEQFDAIARHFYELGLKARKEETK